MSVAKEVSAGAAEGFRQYARAHLEQTAQASRMITATADADRKIHDFESVLRESISRTEKYSQLLLGSVASVYFEVSTRYHYPG